MLVGGLRFGQLAGLEIDIVMPLAGAVDAVGPMQAGIEPLRRIRRRHLMREHIAHFVVIDARILFRVEIAAFPSPIRPGAGKPVEDLLCACLADIALFSRTGLQGVFVGLRAPQPIGHVALFDFSQGGGNAGFPEVFLREHVAGDLAPARRHFDVFGLEHKRSIRIPDFAVRPAELHIRVRRCLVFREETRKAHS